MEPRAPKKEVYILQQLSNHESIFWMLIQRHLDLRGWKTEALSVQSTLGGSIREPSIQSRKSLQTVPPLPTQHAGGLSSTSIARCGAFNRLFEPQTDDRFAPLLHFANSLSDCGLRSSWKTLPPIGFPSPGSPDRSSTGVLQTPCESPRQVCDKVSPTKERAFR
jgi:hypothetical protein